jgi:hypothetical protein
MAGMIFSLKTGRLKEAMSRMEISGFGFAGEVRRIFSTKETDGACAADDESDFLGDDVC